MSLTSKLRSKDSWVNRFFKKEFAKLTDFVKREGATVKALPLKVLLGRTAKRQSSVLHLITGCGCILDLIWSSLCR